MKKFYKIYFAIMIFAIAPFIGAKAQMMTDSVTSGAEYANDVYYSFSNGVVKTVDRSNWDIAFYTTVWSAGVIINDGAGAELKVYPSTDTSGWNAIDTTGMSTWPALYNSTESWEMGAFNQPPTNHPDYGWGVYNTVNHNVVGDSIYILKLIDGTYRKFWMIMKISEENKYVFRYANLDGSNEMTDTLNCNDYTGKNFAYYSVSGNAALDRDPASDSWDILFTKYIAMLPGNTPYPVTGVFNNVNVPAKRFEMVDPAFTDWSSAPMDSTKAPIGYDWKHFDMTNFVYIVEDSLVFFVSTQNKDVYKLIFNSFDYMQGKTVFQKSLISPAAIAGHDIDYKIDIFPNPATDFIVVKTGKINNGQINIYDPTGKVVYNVPVNTNRTRIPVSALNTGVYIITFQNGNRTAVEKLVIR